MITAISNVSPSITSEIHQNSGVFFFHRQVSRTPQVVLGSAVTAVLAARRSKVLQVSRGMGIWVFSFLEKREVLSIVVWMDVWIVWILEFEDMCYIYIVL